MMLKNCALRKIHMLTYGHLSGLQRENDILFEKIQNGSVHSNYVITFLFMTADWITMVFPEMNLGCIRRRKMVFWIDGVFRALCIYAEGAVWR